MSEYSVYVDGVGTFRFRQRTEANKAKIAAEIAALTEGIDPISDYLNCLATALANLRVLTVAAPLGWDLEKLDPEDFVAIMGVMRAAGAIAIQEAGARLPTMSMAVH